VVVLVVALCNPRIGSVESGLIMAINGLQLGNGYSSRKVLFAVVGRLVLTLILQYALSRHLPTILVTVLSVVHLRIGVSGKS
jgi:hypothetical protein